MRGPCTSRGAPGNEGLPTIRGALQSGVTLRGDVVEPSGVEPESAGVPHGPCTRVETNPAPCNQTGSPAVSLVSRFRGRPQQIGKSPVRTKLLTLPAAVILFATACSPSADMDAVDLVQTCVAAAAVDAAQDYISP